MLPRKKVNGDTPLHEILRNYTSTHEILDLLEKCGKDEFSKMTRTINDEGEFSINVVQNSQIPEEERDKIYELLVPFVSEHSLKPLSDPIHFEEICQKFHPIKGSNLYKNLQIACEAANFAREGISISSTHPQITGIPIDEVKKIHSEITETIQKSFHEMNLILQGDDTSYSIERMSKIKTSAVTDRSVTLSFKCTVSPQMRDKLLEVRAKYHLKQGKGNCGEFSEIVWHYVNEHYSSVSVGVYTISNGDHIFPVIDTAPPAYTKYFPHFSEDAVVGDAWAGKIFPAYAIPSELSTYQSKEYLVKNLPIITSFNETFHRLKPCPLNKNKVSLRFSNVPEQQYDEIFRKFYWRTPMVIVPVSSCIIIGSKNFIASQVAEVKAKKEEYTVTANSPLHLIVEPPPAPKSPTPREKNSFFLPKEDLLPNVKKRQYNETSNEIPIKSIVFT